MTDLADADQKELENRLGILLALLDLLELLFPGISVRPNRPLHLAQSQTASYGV